MAYKALHDYLSVLSSQLLSFGHSPIVLPAISQTCQVPTSVNFQPLFHLPGSPPLPSHTQILTWLIPLSLQVFGQMSPPLTFLSAHCIQNISAAHLPSSSLFIPVLLSCTRLLSLYHIIIHLFSFYVSPPFNENSVKVETFSSWFLMLYLRYRSST